MIGTMNILEQEDIIKGLTDADLQAEVSNPKGYFYPFLPVSELDRRNKMREDYEAGQDASATTITENVLASSMGMQPPTGLQSPQMSMGAATPQLPAAPMPSGAPVPATPNSLPSSFPVDGFNQGLAGAGVQYVSTGGVVGMQSGSQVPSGLESITMRSHRAREAAREKLLREGKDPSFYSQRELREIGESILNPPASGDLEEQGYRRQQPGESYTPERMDYGLLSYDPDHPSNVALDALESPFTMSGAQAEARDIEAEQRAREGAEAAQRGEDVAQFIREDEQLGTLGGVFSGGYGLMKDVFGFDDESAAERAAVVQEAMAKGPDPEEPSRLIGLSDLPFVPQLLEQWDWLTSSDDAAPDDVLEETIATFSDAAGNIFPRESLNDPVLDALANRLGVSDEEVVLAGTGTVERDENVEILPRDNADLNTNPTVIRDVSRADPQRHPEAEMIVTPNYEDINYVGGDDLLSMRKLTGNLMTAQEEETEAFRELIANTRADAKKQAFYLGMMGLGSGIAQGDMGAGMDKAIDVASERMARGEGAAAPLEAAMVTRKSQGIRDRIDALGAIANADYRFQQIVAQAQRDQVMSQGDQISLVRSLIPMISESMQLSEAAPGSAEYTAEVSRMLQGFLDSQGISHLLDPDLLSGPVTGSQGGPRAQPLSAYENVE